MDDLTTSYVPVAAGHVCYHCHGMDYRILATGETSEQVVADAISTLASSGVTVIDSDNLGDRDPDSHVLRSRLRVMPCTARMLVAPRDERFFLLPWSNTGRTPFIDDIAATEAEIEEHEAAVAAAGDVTDTAVIVPIRPTRTPEEIAKLKAGWLKDPCWDIEMTEGFEAHHEELLAYRKEVERQWSLERQEQELVSYRARLARASEMGCSLALLDYIETLERRIKRFEDEAQEAAEKAYWADEVAAAKRRRGF